MITEQQVKNIIESKIKGTDIFIVDLFVKPGNRIMVYLDSDSSLTIDDCVDISKHIEKNLDRDTEDFSLDVSSAGLSQPLKHIRQYTKNIGRYLNIVLNDGTKMHGKLQNVDDDGIIIELKKKKEITEERINFDTIKKAKIEITF
jgi:ribosome maturation factor RimP